MKFIGIDLSGPRNITDTAVAVFEEQPGGLRFLKASHRVGDRQILELVTDAGMNGQVVIGIDAPLSYNPGGGDRPSDAELRRLVLEKGRAGVMPPTMIRMVYLTLRGVALTRMLEGIQPEVRLRVVEVHPGAAMLLRGAPAADVAAFKHEAAARAHLVNWLGEMGLSGLPPADGTSDHLVAACAAALAAWQWSEGRAVWRFAARPPEHPYDFAC